MVKNVILLDVSNNEINDFLRNDELHSVNSRIKLISQVRQRRRNLI